MDRTPPRLVVTHPSGELHTNLTEVNIRGEVEPGSNLTVNMYEYANPGGVFDLFFNLNEGPNYFGVTATDRAGNVASVVVWVYRDTFDPVLEVFSPSDGLDTNATDVRVLGRAEEYDTVTITLHRSFTDIVDRPIYPDDEGQFDVLADLEEGVNEIVVTARDRAGNHVTVRRTVTLDTTPPEMELISPGDNALLNVHQVTVVFTVSEDADQVYVNGKRVLGTGELDTVVMLGEGENPITLRAFDLLYNEITIDLTVIVDTVPPVLQVTEPVNASFKTNDPFVEVRGRASDGDLNGITVHVEGGPATVTTDGKFYYLLELDEDGTHVIEVVARDRAGNIARETFTVDLRTEAPLMTLVFDPAEERVDPGTMLHIQGAATGIPLTVTIVHDAAGDRREFTFLLINMSFEHYLDLVDGVNTITVRSEDAYGNWNVTAPHVVNVKEKEVQETPGNDTLYLIAAVLVAVALIVVAYVVLKRP
ncbi:MAG: hypothetical protein GWN89_02865 [Thermoplasmata archaeon]|nr:hypothetical protein [Thermoplasmata archaeon]NIT77535.1 hypothetical protein [Thermoplasmata archaeon]NIU48050.1 hypothetical protein [Thermoplasmata archaeon]NIY03906.1 hypothetical protein [Thermoplasmata archaeon]